MSCVPGERKKAASKNGGGMLAAALARYEQGVKTEHLVTSPGRITLKPLLPPRYSLHL